MTRSSLVPAALTIFFLSLSIFFVERSRRAQKSALDRVADRNTAMVQRVEAQRSFFEQRLEASERGRSRARLQAARQAFDAGRWSALSEHLERIPEAHRGFAWKTLALCAQLIVREIGDQDSLVTSLAVSRDGKRIAAGSDEGSIVVWDVEGARRIVELNEADSVVQLALDATGRRLIALTREGNVSSWLVDEGELMGELEEGAASVAASEVTFFVGCEDGRILEWNGEFDSSPIERMRHEDVVNSIAIGSSGEVVTGSDDWMVRRVGDDEPLQGASNWITSVSIDPSGRYVAGGTDGGVVRVWDLRSREVVTRVEVSETAVRALSFSSGSEQVRIGAICEDGYVAIAPLAESISIDRFRLPPDLAADLEGAAFGPGFEWIAFAGADEKVRILTRERPVPMHLLQVADSRVRSLATDRAGERILVGASDGRAYTIDGKNGRSLLELDGHDEYVTATALSMDVTRAVTADRAGRVRLWSLANGERLLDVDAGGRVDAVAGNADHFVSITRKGTARTFDSTSGELRLEQRGPLAGVFATTIDPVAENSAWIANGGTIRMWSTKDGARTFGIRDRELQRPDSLAVSLDGSVALVIAAGISATVYDVEREKVLSRMRDEEGMFVCAAITPDGSIVATAARDGRLKLWDVETGEELLELGVGREGEAISTAMRFTPDGRRLLVGDTSGRLVVWETNLEALTQWGRER